MMVQLEARHLFQSKTKRKRRRYWSARTLIISLTLLFVIWLAIRWWLSPLNLPDLLLELILLAETAAAATLSCVWVVVLWRSRFSQRNTTNIASTLFVPADLYALSPSDFEKYVAYLFRRKGYQVNLRGRRGDLGVDLELKDAKGRQAIVQCKRYQKSVGPDTVRELYGTLIHEQASHAFLVTTANISQAARSWAKGKPMTLIDGTTLHKIANSLAQRADG